MSSVSKNSKDPQKHSRNLSGGSESQAASSTQVNNDCVFELQGDLAHKSLETFQNVISVNQNFWKGISTGMESSKEYSLIVDLKTRMEQMEQDGNLLANVLETNLPEASRLSEKLVENARVNVLRYSLVKQKSTFDETFKEPALTDMRAVLDVTKNLHSIISRKRGFVGNQHDQPPACKLSPKTLQERATECTQHTLQDPQQQQSNTFSSSNSENVVTLQQTNDSSVVLCSGGQQEEKQNELSKNVGDCSGQSTSEEYAFDPDDSGKNGESEDTDDSDDEKSNVSDEEETEEIDSDSDEDSDLADSGDDDQVEDERAVGKNVQKKRTPVGQETSQRQLLSAVEFFSELGKHGIGSENFILTFKNNEEHVFKTQKDLLATFKNGHEFSQKHKILDKICVILDIEGLGMELPKDFDFKNVLNYVKTKNKGQPRYSVINSSTQEYFPQQMCIANILKQIKKVTRKTRIMNLLSCEISKTSMSLNNFKIVPSFVEKNCILLELKSALENKLEKLKSVSGKRIKKSQKVEIGQIKMIEKLVPSYLKYFMISQAGAFTDVHLDLAGTSVFYYLPVGEKIFYFAPDSDECIEKYESYEKLINEQKEREKEQQEKKNEDKTAKPTWIGEQLNSEWRRVVLKAGNILMLKGGHLHMVYTVKNSLVIAGNFLTLENMAMQFKVTKLEERTLGHKKDQLFHGFWDCMFAYIEFVLLPKLEQLSENEVSKYREAGKVILKEMKNKKTTIYQKEKAISLIQKLQNFYPQEALNDKANAEIDSADDQPSTSAT